MASVSNPCSEKAGAWASVGCAPGPSDAVGRGALARARPGVRTMQHLEARCHQSRLLLGATCAARTSCLSRTVQSTATCTFAVRCSSVQALRQAATKVWATKVGDQDRTARNWKYALIRCLRSVWMGSSPSRKLKNAIGKCFWKPRRIALSDQTGSNQDHKSQVLELVAGCCAGSLSRALLITHRSSQSARSSWWCCGLRHCDDRCGAAASLQVRRCLGRAIGEGTRCGVQRKLYNN